MSSAQPDAEEFMAQVEQLVQQAPGLSHLQAGLVVAAALNIANDSRSFARLLGVAHALVLRDMNALAALGDFIRITRRDARTLRSHYELGAESLRLLQSQQVEPDEAKNGIC